MDFLIHWPPGPVVATVQCQGLYCSYNFIISIYILLSVYTLIHDCSKGYSELC